MAVPRQLNGGPRIPTERADRSAPGLMPPAVLSIVRYAGSGVGEASIQAPETQTERGGRRGALLRPAEGRRHGAARRRGDEAPSAFRCSSRWGRSGAGRAQRASAESPITKAGRPRKLRSAPVRMYGGRGGWPQRLASLSDFYPYASSRPGCARRGPDRHDDSPAVESADTRGTVAGHHRRAHR